MKNAKIRSALDRIEIASPCTVDWDKMKGDDQARFCLQCEKHVYNFSDMRSLEVERLIRETEGKICARFYLRRDGTVLTEDCPLGLRIARTGVRKICKAVASALSVIFTMMPARADNQQKNDGIFKLNQELVHKWFGHQAFMGQIIDSKPIIIEENGTAAAPDFVSVAWAEFKARKFNEAIATCTKALSLDSNSVAAYDTRGHAELELKQYQNAVADFSKAISLDATLGSTHYFRAMAYRSLGKDDLARKDELRASELGYTPTSKDAN